MISRRTVLLAAAAACAQAGRVWGADGAAAGGVLTASDVHVSDYPTVQALRWMGDMISRESGGELGLRVYHSGQLGRENDTVDLARFGALDSPGAPGAGRLPRAHCSGVTARRSPGTV